MVDLRESSFYQLVREEIMAEIEAESKGKAHSEGYTAGRLISLRRMILSVGSRKFGESPPGVEAILEGITNRSRLEAIWDRLLDVSSWEDYLAEP